MTVFRNSSGQVIRHAGNLVMRDESCCCRDTPTCSPCDGKYGGDAPDAIIVDLMPVSATADRELCFTAAGGEYLVERIDESWSGSSNLKCLMLGDEITATCFYIDGSCYSSPVRPGFGWYTDSTPNMWLAGYFGNYSTTGGNAWITIYFFSELLDTADGDRPSYEGCFSALKHTHTGMSIGGYGYRKCSDCTLSSAAITTTTHVIRAWQA